MPVKPRRWVPPKKVGKRYIAEVELTREKAARASNGRVQIMLGYDRLAAAERLALKLSSRPPYKSVAVNDLIRAALDEYIPRKEADLALETRAPCAVANVHGQCFCATCGYRWSADGPRPKCPMKE